MNTKKVLRILYLILLSIAINNSAKAQYVPLTEIPQAQNPYQAINPNRIKPINVEKIEIHTTPPDITKIQIQQTDNPGEQKEEKIPSETREARIQRYWTTFKGKPARDSITLGMFSQHTGAHWKDFNGTNNMIGGQYKGITASYFRNSFYKDSYTFGVSREVYRKQIAQGIDIDFTYKAGGLYGYGNRYPNLFKVTPVIMPYMGITVYGVGADFCVIPSDRPIFTVNFRMSKPNFASLLKKDKNPL